MVSKGSGCIPGWVIRFVVPAAVFVVVVTGLIVVRVLTADSEEEALGSIVIVFFTGYHLTLFTGSWEPGVATFTLFHYILAYISIPVEFSSDAEVDDFIVTFLLVVLAGSVVGFVQIWTDYAPAFVTERWRWTNLATRAQRLWWILAIRVMTGFLMIPISGTLDYLPIPFTWRAIASLILLPGLYLLLAWSLFRSPFRRALNTRPLLPTLIVHWMGVALLWLARISGLVETVREEAVVIGGYALVVILVLVVVRCIRGRRKPRL